MSEIEVIKCGQANCFVIVGTAGAILIDTGIDKYRNTLLEKVKEYNIKVIILTHGHMDHIGNAKFFADYFKAKIAMNRNDYVLIRDNKKREIYSTGLLGYILKKASEMAMETNKVDDFEPDIYLTEGDNLNEYGINGEIIELAGHTKGSLGIIVDSTKAIVGDAVINILKPSKAVIAENFAQVNKSVQKLKKLNLEKIYVGHGTEISGRKLKKLMESADN